MSFLDMLLLQSTVFMFVQDQNLHKNIPIMENGMCYIRINKVYTEDFFKDTAIIFSKGIFKKSLVEL